MQLVATYSDSFLLLHFGTLMRAILILVRMLADAFNIQCKSV